jgi:hypothetical protein
MNGQRLLVRVLIVGLLLVPMIGSGPPPARAADFDQDGYADLAIGVYWETVDDQFRAGAVNVLYGTSVGIMAANDQLWTQDDLSPHYSMNADYFGQELAAGDFDGDGAADLAMGTPLKDRAGGLDGGAVFVLYGSSPEGLVSEGFQCWDQDSPGVPGVVEEWDAFGHALAVGDFDGDGYDDLAVGVPYEDIGTEANAGAVNVLYGTAAGLTGYGSQLWYEDYNGLPGAAEAGDWFGFSLAAGDFDRDGHDDLAISIPYEDMLGVDDFGRVVILYGTASGLTAAGNQSWQEGQDGIGDVAEEDDRFGWALATGDFDGDRYDDLAIGVPFEELVLQEEAGIVHVLYGSSAGLTAAGTQSFCLEAYTAGDRYGFALTTGDLNGDGFDELAVGIPGEDLYSWFNVGAVEILYGWSGGLHRRSGRDDFWTQGDDGMVDGPTEGDRFGSALAAGDFNNDHYADLAVGIPGEDVATISNAGAVHILYGSADGITATGNQWWHQDSPGVEGVAEEWDSFGISLAAIPRTSHKAYLPLVLKNY